MTLCDACKGVYDSVIDKREQPSSAMTRSVAMDQVCARDTSTIPVAAKLAMEGRVVSVLNELSGSSRTNTDEIALQQVLESYFWEDDDYNEDPPNGTTHY